MKFCAKMLDVLYMREFQAIAATLSKLAKDCVMILAEEQMHFIVNEEHCSTSSPLVWVNIAAHDYFPEYQMTPARPDREFIVLVMSAMHLSRALAVLRSGSSSSSVHSCKLTLKQIQFPCVSVIASVVSPNSSEPREVVHDVPVTVVPVSDWPSFMLPKVPSTQIVLGVPSLRLLRSLIDKLKNISPSLIFHGSTAGELNLVAESDMATITTRFRKLLLHKPDQRQPSTGAEAESEISCSVDTRKTSAFFNALQLPNEEIMIGIDSERCICLQLDIRSNVVLHSILPAVCV